MHIFLSHLQYLIVNGNYYSAGAGDLVVTVSHDLRGFLTTSAIARSSSSRSDSITFMWDNSTMGRRGIKGGENKEAGNRVGGGGSSSSSSSGSSSSGTFSSSEHTVECIQYHSITLSSAYYGPAVKNGLPRVYIRTKLLPVGTFTQTSTHGHSDQWGTLEYAETGYTPAMPATHIRESIVRECEIPPWGPRPGLPGVQIGRSPVTAICSHPLLHQLVVGFTDDSLCIFDCASG